MGFCYVHLHIIWLARVRSQLSVCASSLETKNDVDAANRRQVQRRPSDCASGVAWPSRRPQVHVVTEYGRPWTSIMTSAVNPKSSVPCKRVLLCADAGVGADDARPHAHFTALDIQ